MRPPGGAEHAELSPLLVVVGPTGSGKTDLAIKLAQALDGEIINADSVQIYEHFDVGSAKPSARELGLSPHHLIGVLDPLDDIEASRFAALADLAIGEVRARGRTPIVCGGTFLWVRALLYGLADAPPGDPAVRRRHQDLVEREGRAALHAGLARIDPLSAQRLHENDVLRVSRALEVFELSGQKLSDLHAAHGFSRLRYRAQLLGLAWERSRHDERLARRVDAMLERGLVEEVRDLLARGYGSARAMSAVGYKQVREALDANQAHDRGALALAITRATRLFARRQRTWLREQAIDWLPGDPLEQAAAWPAWLERCRSTLASEAQ